MFIYFVCGNGFWQFGLQVMYGQKVGFICGVLLQVIFFWFVVIVVIYVLIEFGLSGEGKDVVVKISVLYCGEWFSIGLSGGKYKGNCGEIFFEYFYF